MYVQECINVLLWDVHVIGWLSQIEFLTYNMAASHSDLFLT